MTLDDQTLAALRVLLDKQAIHEVLMRYCRGIDRCDEELLRSVYHHDATDNHGQFNGKAADFVPWAIKSLRRDERTTHFLCNELIEVEGGFRPLRELFIRGSSTQNERQNGHYGFDVWRPLR